ncbi:MAG: hypothetical protein IH624_11625 [Phycisphaerae bacterium]|nr:hypothetical protein [Phycisphaerae bacterium]
MSTFCDSAEDPIVTRDESGVRMVWLFTVEDGELLEAAGAVRSGVMTVALDPNSLPAAADELLLPALVTVRSRLAEEEALVRGATSTYRRTGDEKVCVVGALTLEGEDRVGVLRLTGGETG